MKTIVLGRCDVIICNASEKGSGLMNEVLILDAQENRKGKCIAQPHPELVGQCYDINDPRLLARIVVAHPDGAAVLIEHLEHAAGVMKKQLFLEEHDIARKFGKETP